VIGARHSAPAIASLSRRQFSNGLLQNFNLIEGKNPPQIRANFRLSAPKPWVIMASFVGV